MCALTKPLGGRAEDWRDQNGNISSEVWCRTSVLT